MSDVRMYGEEDADLAPLAERRVAVIGYGSQGHAHARNLSDSGVDVVVGLREGSSSAPLAREHGLEVRGIGEAAASAELVAVLIPDTAQPEVFEGKVEPGLEEGDALLFAHGFNVHFGEIEPPPGVDVIMVAPKSPGEMLRREYEAGRGVPALVAVERDATGRAGDLTLAYASGLGSTRAGVLETTFADETETDLFGEQAVLCGGLTSLIQAGFETLVDAGYPAELAYFECLHEMKLIVDLMYQGGIGGMRAGVSDTAEYGDYVSGDRVVGEPSREAMRTLLEEVRSGAFAERFIEDARSGGEEMERHREREARHPIEEVGARLRERMAWL